MNKERALVTGANGFIGSRLIRQLVAAPVFLSQLQR
jgi:nucleoside-diphosphate-sugar epimerase